MNTETPAKLQYLRNAASSIEGLIVYERFFEDKRKTTKMYFLMFKGASISPTLDYKNMNHFLLGFTKAIELSGDWNRYNPFKLTK